MAERSTVPSESRERIAATPRWLELGVVVVLTAVAAYARFRQLGALSQAGDEGFTFLAVRGVLGEGIPRLPSGVVYWKSLLYTYLAALPAAAAGLASPSIDAALRIPSALASTALVPALWWCGRRLFRPAVGLAAAAILCLHLWEVEMSRHARYYPVLQLALVGFVERFHAVHIRGETRARVGLLIAFLLALLSHTIALTFVLLYVPLLAVRGARLLRSRESWIEIGAMALIVVAWLAFESRWEVGFVRRPDAGRFGAVAALTRGLSGYSLEFFEWTWRLVPGLVAIAAVSGFVWAAASLADGARTGASDDARFAFILTATVVAAIAALGLGEAHAQPRYLFFLLPFLVVVASATSVGAGRAAGAWLGGERGRRVGQAVGALLVVALGVHDAHAREAWRVPERRHQDRLEDGRYLPSTHVRFVWDTSAPGRYVAEHLRPGDRVLGTHAIFAYVYAGRLDGWIWNGNRDVWDAYHEDQDGRLVDNYVGAPLIRKRAELEALLNDGAGRVWIVTTPSIGEEGHVDPRIRRLLETHDEARVLNGRDGVSGVYLFENGRGTLPATEGHLTEVELLAGHQGSNVLDPVASRGAAREARQNRERAGTIFSSGSFVPSPAASAAVLRIAGEGAGVLLQAARTRGGPVVAERFAQVSTAAYADLVLPFVQQSADAIELRLHWDGRGWIRADRFDVRPVEQSAPTSADAGTAPGTLRVACFGDSITALSGYPPILESRLTTRLGRPVRVLNRGRPGHNTRDFLAAMERGGLLEQADPDIVLLQLGTNDVRIDADRTTRSEFEGNLAEIASRVRAFTNGRGEHPRLLLATVPPVRTRRAPFGPESADRIDSEINPAIRALGEARGIPCHDTTSIYRDPDALEDGVHPTLAIAERLADSWVDPIAAALR